jgi:hypothetical protein
MTNSKQNLMRISIISGAVLIVVVFFLWNKNYFAKTGPLSSHSTPAGLSSPVNQKLPENQNTFLNVTKIAKKSKAIVDAYLGPSDHHESISPSNAPCPCEQYDYKDGNIQVVYMKDVADWLTIYHMNTLKFTPATILEALGIPYTNPVIQNQDVIKWNDFNGYDQLSAFSDGKGGISYVFLKAITH